MQSPTIKKRSAAVHSIFIFWVGGMCTYRKTVLDTEKGQGKNICRIDRQTGTVYGVGHSILPQMTKVNTQPLTFE